MLRLLTEVDKICMLLLQSATMNYCWSRKIHSGQYDCVEISSSFTCLVVCFLLFVGLFVFGRWGDCDCVS